MDDKDIEALSLSLEMTYGDFISNKDLDDLLGCTVSNQEKYTRDDFNRLSWTRCHRLETLKLKLMKNRKMCLINVRCEGYRVAMPDEIPSLSINSLVAAIERAASKSLTMIETAPTHLMSSKAKADLLAAESRITRITCHSTKKPLLESAEDYLKAIN